MNKDTPSCIDLGAAIVALIKSGGACIITGDPCDDGTFDIAVSQTLQPDDVARLKQMSDELVKDGPHYDADEIKASIAHGREPQQRGKH